MTAASSVKIRSMDMPIIDRVFGMEGGFVLDFSNRTFAEFFHDEVNVDIYNPHGEIIAIVFARSRKPEVLEGHCQRKLA